MAYSNDFIYGLHDAGGEQLLGGKGWTVYTEAIGRNPNDYGGKDYRGAGQLGVIARLNHGYGSTGTLPTRDKYADFARRCANFIRSSSGCNKFIIGNEPNHQQEWPGGQPIYPSDYADCYKAVKAALNADAANYEILLAAAAPWNNQVTYASNTTGDWVRYLQDQITSIGIDKVDGIALHAYTHGYDPNLIRSTAKMNPPFQNRHYNFYVYRDYLSGLRDIKYLKKPLYITECNGDDKNWPGNNGWVQTMYAEIDSWNQRNPDQQIKCSALFRWMDDPYGWSLSKSPGSQQDLRTAVSSNYKWKPYATTPPPTPLPPPGSDLQWLDQELDALGKVIQTAAQDALTSYHKSKKAYDDLQRIRAKLGLKT